MTDSAKIDVTRYELDANEVVISKEETDTTKTYTAFIKHNFSASATYTDPITLSMGEVTTGKALVFTSDVALSVKLAPATAAFEDTKMIVADMDFTGVEVTNDSGEDATIKADIYGE